jgi:tetratricopeptide (TPR) repeat protein
LLNAATAYRAAGNNEYALELYRETEAVYRKYLPEGDARCAAVYNNMSDLYAEKGDSAAAAELLLRALDIVKSLEGTAVEQAIIRGNLANIYAAMGRDEDALAELTAALSIYEEQKSPDGKKDPHYAAALAALAMCRQREGRCQEAVELYEQTLEEIQIHYGKNQNYYLNCRNIAQVYLAMGEKEKAAQYLSIADGAPLKDGGQP